MRLERPSHATVVAYLALFAALGSGAYAASQLPKNSVGTKQLKKNAVTKAKIKKNSVTGAKVKESTLGTVPAAQTAATATAANTASVANSLAPSEGWHKVGAPGEPVFLGSWHNGLYQSVAFYKDHEGIVHLRGDAETAAPQTANVIFDLPPGYRPAAGKIFEALAICYGGVGSCSGVGQFVINGTGVPTEHDGGVRAPSGGHTVVLDGISFRAES